MGLDDFATAGTMPIPLPDGRAGAPGSPAPADPVSSVAEDLFDFPVIEMKLELEAAPVKAGASPSPAATAPASPAARPIADPVPVKPSAAGAKVTAHPVAKEKPKPNLKDEPKNDRSARAGADAKAPSAKVPVEPGHPRATKIRARKIGSPSPAGTTSLLLGAMLLLNGGVFFFFWHTSRSFRVGLEDLRNDLAVTAHDLRIAATRPIAVQAAPPSQPVAVASEKSESIVKKDNPTPLDAFERTSLDLASQEIEAGECAAARKRLYRLLAVADRIDADLRADIEARARYTIAGSYSAQREKLAADGQRAGGPQEGPRAGSPNSAKEEKR